MVIDPANDTATGQGTDDIDGINMFIGSPFDDTLIFDGSTAAFNGGAGIDLVDASLTTTGVSHRPRLAGRRSRSRALGPRRTAWRTRWAGRATTPCSATT